MPARVTARRFSNNNEFSRGCTLNWEIVHARRPSDNSIFGANAVFFAFSPADRFFNSASDERYNARGAPVQVWVISGRAWLTSSQFHDNWARVGARLSRCKHFLWKSFPSTHKRRLVHCCRVEKLLFNEAKISPGFWPSLEIWWK